MDCFDEWFRNLDSEESGDQDGRMQDVDVERMERISRMVRVTNDEVLNRVNEQRKNHEEK